MTASLGGLLFGFDTAVIAGVTRALTDRFILTPTSLGFTVAIALWGTIVGAACDGYALLCHHQTKSGWLKSNAMSKHKPS